MRLGLRAKLLGLLLAFGVVPLAAAIGAGYTVSRSVILDQSAGALGELAARQSVHVATELRRQRLLLRTITSHLEGQDGLLAGPPAALSRVLAQSLLDDGVFDGLRLVGADGRVLASVVLRDAAPHWPAGDPAAGPARRPIRVHREGTQIVAYLLATPVGAVGGGPPRAWLEGHVQAGDFARLFSVPSHMMGGVESGVFEGSGAPIIVGHTHAADALRADLPAAGDSAPRVTAGRQMLSAAAAVAGTDWVFVASLPTRIALAPLARLRNTAVAGAAVLVAVIVLTGWIAAASVSTPLGELAAAAQRLGRAGAHRPIARHGRDEVGVLVDAFNRMAEDLGRSRAELEALHARDMERAQQLATVGELASGVAHEIRNPVTGALGALDLALQRLPDDAPARPMLVEARAQLTRIESTATQLLRYARPPELREVEVDADMLVVRAVQVVAGPAQAAQVAVRRPPAPAASVRVDPELMVQVLVNLLLNGIAAAGPGGAVTVRLALHPGELWMGVEDTGPGIPPDQRERVLRPFYTTKPQGTGLGLSISQQIVVRHGGRLRIGDAPGGGAAVAVVLPLADGKGRTT